MPTILTPREVFEGIAGQTKDSPIVERLCTDAFVEIDCELIPVEHCPLESAAVALDGNLCKCGKKCEANTLAACFRANEKILEINPALREECRVVVKEESESSRLTIGASGGGSHTHGQDPNARVKVTDWARDSRSKSFGSIDKLIQHKLQSKK